MVSGLLRFASTSRRFSDVDWRRRDLSNLPHDTHMQVQQEQKTLPLDLRGLVHQLLLQLHWKLLPFCLC